MIRNFQFRSWFCLWFCCNCFCTFSDTDMGFYGIVSLHRFPKKSSFTSCSICHPQKNAPTPYAKPRTTPSCKRSEVKSPWPPDPMQSITVDWTILYTSFGACVSFFRYSQWCVTTYLLSILLHQESRRRKLIGSAHLVLADSSEAQICRCRYFREFSVAVALPDGRRPPQYQNV